MEHFVIGTLQISKSLISLLFVSYCQRRISSGYTKGIDFCWIVRIQYAEDLLGHSHPQIYDSHSCVEINLNMAAQVGQELEANGPIFAYEEGESISMKISNLDTKAKDKMLFFNDPLVNAKNPLRNMQQQHHQSQLLPFF